MDDEKKDTENFRTSNEKKDTENVRTGNEKKDNKKKKKVSKLFIFLILIIAICTGIFFGYKEFFKDSNEKVKVKKDKKKVETSYRMSGNSIEDFDLYFLKLENEKVNKIYSPLSIKYALAMLNEGTAGDSKLQISSIIDKRYL